RETKIKKKTRRKWKIRIRLLLIIASLLLPASQKDCFVELKSCYEKGTDEEIAEFIYQTLDVNGNEVFTRYQSWQLRLNRYFIFALERL
ncbi:unnamed protein product, partial [Arabidopsis halleri]